MFTIEELQSKELDSLIPLAKELGIKKPASEKEDVIYQILDAQAENYASNAPQRESRERRRKQSAQQVADSEDQQPKKRGRKPKAQQAEAKADEQQPVAAIAAEETAQPKKRGRKPKKELTQNEMEETQEVAAAATTGDENNTDVQTVEKRRRGRPRRSEQADAATTTGEGSETPAPVKKIALARTISSGLTLASRRKNAPVAKPVAEVEKPVETTDVQPEAPVESIPVEPTADPEIIETPAVAAEPVNNEVEAVEKTSDFVEFFPKKENSTRFGARKVAEQDAKPTPAVRMDVPVSIQEPTASSQHPGMRKIKHSQPQQAFDFNGLIECSGVLEVMPEGHGFLRSADFNYMPSPDDVYLTREQIRTAHIKTGDVVECTLRAPRENDKYFPMARLLRVNGRSPEYIRDRVPFEHLTPLFPDEKFDITSGRTCNISTRVVDMFSPIGKGQRGLIVAPPKTGKTILLKDIANAIAENHPETYIMILLIDERPEEVTDMIRSVNAEVISSTFDEPADRHVRIANIVLEKAKRMVECGHDVVILLDSITRLARAYNTVTPTSSKILSGGVDANALQKPKRFFGAARNIENGGSLTIIATALTETSSKMDEVIFEEFKGTGNMELQLDRKLSNKRIFPAVDIMASSTRRDDLLLRPETQNRMWILRRFLSDRNSIEAMEFIKDRMERTTDNDELLRTMNE